MSEVHYAKEDFNEKKMGKRIITIITTFLMIVGSSLNALAKESASGNLDIENIISIDVTQATEDTGKTLEEVGITSMTRATSMPSKTWDWTKGDYTGSFSISYEYSYSLYNFTGYSQYYVDTTASRDKETAASNYYKVYILKGSGQGTIVTSYEWNSTEKKTVRFYNLESGTKYAICIAKANDGSTLSGDYKVYY